jgi:predicted DNA-binding transcriptional regulator AlpA
MNDTLDMTRGTVPLVEAARLLGVGRSAAYETEKAGTFPCRTIRIGRRVRVPVADLRRVLGLDAPDPQ